MLGCRQPAAIRPITAAKPLYWKRTGATHQTTPDCTSRAGSLEIRHEDLDLSVLIRAPPVPSEWQTMRPERSTASRRPVVISGKAVLATNLARAGWAFLGGPRFPGPKGFAGSRSTYRCPHRVGRTADMVGTVNTRAVASV